jgi:alpha-L-fucosidase
MAAFGARVTGTFGTDLARGTTASSDSGTPVLAVDGNLDTAWQPTGTTGSLVLDLGQNKTFNVINVQENLDVGMRVQSFAVDQWNGTAWTQIAADTTVGHKKLVRLAAPVTAGRVRLRVTSTRAAPAIASLGLFLRDGVTTRSGPVPSGLTGKCLDDNASGSADGTRVQLWDCNGTNAQRWAVTFDGTIRVFGKCLDIIGGGTANGSLVHLWTCNNGGNQQWVALNNGSLMNPQSGRCLDIPGATTANGTQLIIWDCNAGANQRWTLP